MTRRGEFEPRPASLQGLYSITMSHQSTIFIPSPGGFILPELVQGEGGIVQHLLGRHTAKRWPGQVCYHHYPPSQGYLVGALTQDAHPPTLATPPGSEGLTAGSGSGPQ